METLVDVVARSRRSAEPALRAPGADQFFDYRRLCTTAWKTANFLHARGVRERTTVGVSADARAEPVLATVGAALLGANAVVGASRDVDARAVVSHVDAVDECDLDPGTQRVAFDGEHDDPDVYYFERDVWSENPTMPPEADARSPGDVALDAASGARWSNNGTVTHGDLLDAARDVADRLSLDDDTEIAVRAPISDARAFAAGVLAPLAVGGSVLFPGEDATGDVAVTAPDVDAPEARTLGVRDVEF